jgi:hypothetical protein
VLWYLKEMVNFGTGQGVCVRRVHVGFFYIHKECVGLIRRL